jgi:hypothetical protein
MGAVGLGLAAFTAAAPARRLPQEGGGAEALERARDRVARGVQRQGRGLCWCVVLCVVGVGVLSGSRVRGGGGGREGGAAWPDCRCRRRRRRAALTSNRSSCVKARTARTAGNGSSASSSPRAGARGLAVICGLGERTRAGRCREAETQSRPRRSAYFGAMVVRRARSTSLWLVLGVSCVRLWIGCVQEAGGGVSRPHRPSQPPPLSSLSLLSSSPPSSLAPPFLRLFLFPKPSKDAVDQDHAHQARAGQEAEAEPADPLLDPVRFSPRARRGQQCGRPTTSLSFDPPHRSSARPSGLRPSLTGASATESLEWPWSDGGARRRTNRERGGRTPTPFLPSLRGGCSPSPRCLRSASSLSRLVRHRPRRDPAAAGRY